MELGLPCETIIAWLPFFFLSYISSHHSALFLFDDVQIMDVRIGSILMAFEVCSSVPENGNELFHCCIQSLLECLFFQIGASFHKTNVASFVVDLEVSEVCSVFGACVLIQGSRGL